MLTQNKIVLNTLAASLTVLSMTPMSESYADTHNVWGGINYVYNDGVGVSNNTNSNGYEIVLGGKPIDWLNLDLRNNFAAATTDFDASSVTVNGVSVPVAARSVDTNNSRLEVGAMPFYDFSNGLGVYSRIALGYAAPDNFDNFMYGNAEVGASYKPYNMNNTQLALGYRYQDQFGSDTIGIGNTKFDRNFRTNSLVASAEYSINSRDSITFGYEYAEGDLNYNEWKIGYLGHF
jgi:hypothetical protein